jgi:hypothetical protein
MLEDFLVASFDKEFPNLLDFTEPILADQKSALVPTSDYLAYAETSPLQRPADSEPARPRV